MTKDLYVEIERASEGAPWVVFSNSLMTDLSIFDAQVDAVKGAFNVLRYDQRGHGRSPTSPERYGFDALGRDVIDLLDAHNIARCVFVGLSMGTPTGLSAYRQAPEKFSSLMLVDGQAKSTEASKSHWDERIAFARANGMDAVAAQTVKRWLRPHHHDLPMAETLHAMLAATPLEGFVAGAEALQAYDQSAGVASVDIPVLLVAGANDGVLPEVMAGLAAKMPKARFEAIEDAGHVPNFESPEDFNRVMIAFLNAQT